ncbi:hypothetical protein SAMN05444166_6987 [Singulisphaera sp. GP187]|uniref:hypothetical protein n=1 Tax=Singulisphaera sp. GP187 TaxID=1882752 RepID=UPI00092C345B|nr:hypothetical protein [Singulisphaera sp. GP187]SIO62237.1 hypothetical protein SAMN05444166_6987 [Singulisphaera sp. GP187]
MPTLQLRQRGSALPGGLLGMLILMAVVETYVARHDLDYTRPDFWDWKLTGRNAQTKTRDCQVLCFGTSRIQQSIVPKVIEHESGLKTWNLGICWGQAPASYYLLKRALESGAKPTSILVEYHPTVLTGDPWGAKGFWPDLLNFKETLDLAWAARDATFFGATALAHNVPTVKDRSQIQAMVLAALSGKYASNWGPTLTAMRNRNFNRGAFVMPDNGGFHGEIGSIYQDAFFGKPWSCTTLNASYIRKFLDLASSRNIQVYWVLPPFAAELQAKREQANNVARYTNFVRGWMAEYPSLTVLDAEYSHFDLNVFFDAAHLNRQGALALSALVGKQLRTQQAQPPKDRWVRLPEYQECRPTFRVEDMRMSQVYLQQTGKLRK